jgi:Xaa-Pro aminopeptidase
MPVHAFAHRLKQLQTQIPVDQGWLIANPTDIQYLTGFVSLVAEEREALLLVTHQHAHLMYSAFSPVTKLPEITYHTGVYNQKISHHLNTIFTSKSFTTLLLDEQRLYLNEYRVFESTAQKHHLTLKALSTRTLEQQRMIKEPSEIVLLTQAGSCANQAWQQLEKWIKPGVTELQVKQKLEQLLLEFGSQRAAFPTIVAFGPNSALPHHQPTDTILEPNTAVLIDFGATIQEYRSDMTRTMWVGDQPHPTFTTLEQIVKEAYHQTIAVLKDSFKQGQPLKALDVDDVARSIIRDAGYEAAFIHTTGHGIGLDIHEQPSLSWSNTAALKPGFAITIEPGIYLEGLFGYRYENTVLYGHDNLTILTENSH